MYVVVLMAATETNLAAGLATLFFYGIFPCGVLMYLLGTGRRREKRRAKEQAELESQNAQQAAPASLSDGESTNEGR